MAAKRTTRSTSSRRHNRAAYRSGLEGKVSASLESRRVAAWYETVKLNYTPAPRRYTPDFLVRSRRGHEFYVETKGYFDAADRRKFLEVLASNPGIDLRLVFQRARTPISKGSKTTYGDWANKHGITWAEGDVPDEWLDE